MKPVNTHYIFNLKDLGDERGGLTVLTSGVEIPFEIKRVFYNFNTKEGVERGNHANIRSSFVFISLSGSCLVEVDDGTYKHEYLLDEPTKALFVGKGIWKTMKDFSEDNVLLILSDNSYDATEYIKDYGEYVNQKKSKGNSK